MKQLSIITINYNNRNGLLKTIQSVINQKFKNFEWIIVDGDSTDGSKKILSDFKNHFTHCISEKDKGIYDAMNKGIKKATGEYLLFLNSGDYLCNKYTLEKVFCRKYYTDFITGNTIKVIDENKSYLDLGINSDVITCIDLLKKGLNHPSTFIKRELFYKFGFYDDTLKIVSDWKFFFNSIILKNCSIKYINVNISCFDLNGISCNSKFKALQKKERNDYLQSVLPLRIIDDYNFTIQYNEVKKYQLSKILFALLYRAVIFYEKIRGYILPPQ